jgi:NADH dehydrogenase/NADH:ubiquinone oxidoreductase subunit G
MNTVRLTIDGKSVEVDKGASVLDAARKAGVDIPTLCHHPKLEPFGACRMCLVEIEKHGRKRTVASCAFPAEDGLVVTSSTPKIERMRKLIVELLWPAYTTPAKGMKIEKSRFTGALPDCSLCGLCVRYCRDVVKKNALYFQGRGVDRCVAFVPGMAHECDSCRACFDLCSSGWVVSRYAAQASADYDERPCFPGMTEC